MSQDTLTIIKPDDFHLHIRQGDMLRKVLPDSLLWCRRAIVMPNTVPPVLTGEDAVRYAAEIREACGDVPFTPLLTIQIIPATTPEHVRAAKVAGVTAGKVYPKGMTTNSENGVEDYEALFPVFAAMEEANMVLCLHGEHPGQEIDCLDREYLFLDILSKIAQAFPRLKIVLEHVTTTLAVATVRALPENVAATITVHHLFLTLNNVIGHMLEPHHFCKPVAKRFSDRASLKEAAMSGERKFFLGTDSAPHPKEKKECSGGCAGIYTAPVAIPLLAELFEDHGVLHKLEGFTSRSGAEFYGLPVNTETLTLERSVWEVPRTVHGIVPFMAGKTLRWRLSK